MGKRIAIIEGHPDPDPHRFNRALADAYAEGAQEAGHEVHRVRLGEIDFPLIHSKAEWDSGKIPPALEQAQDSIAWAEHLVILYPLWLGSMPALLKGFLEQAMRPGFAIPTTGNYPLQHRLLKGKSARVVVTMGMPALFYRWYFRAHSLKSLERNVLKYCGIRPVKETLVGMVDNLSPGKRAKWIETLQQLGRSGS